MSMSEKKYGLILPSKQKSGRAQHSGRPGGPTRQQLGLSRSAAAAAVFADEDEDDDDEQDGRADVNATLQRESQRQAEKARRQMEQVMEEDATVYQYDEVYDDMAQKRQAADPRHERMSNTQQKQKPRYIGRLLAAAQERKKLDELRVERQVQKEREQERLEGADVPEEKFVTSAYKKKMEELRLLEQQERLKEKEEESNDVRKKGDMSSFYQHLLTTNAAMGASEAGDKPDDAADGKTKMPSSASHNNGDDRGKHTREDRDREARPRDRASDGHDLERRRDRDQDRYRHREDRRRDDHRRERRRSRSPVSSRRRDETRRSPHRDRDRDVREAPSRQLAEPSAQGASTSEADERTQKIKEAFAKHTTDKDAEAARQRYLARKRSGAKPRPVAMDD